MWIPECQNAKMDFEPVVGGSGEVRLIGSRLLEAIGAATEYGSGEVPGIEGYSICGFSRGYRIKC